MADNYQALFSLCVLRRKVGRCASAASPPLPKIMLCVGPQRMPTLPSHRRRCKRQQPDSGTTCLVMVAAQPGMLAVLYFLNVPCSQVCCPLAPVCVCPPLGSLAGLRKRLNPKGFPQIACAAVGISSRRSRLVKGEAGFRHRQRSAHCQIFDEARGLLVAVASFSVKGGHVSQSSDRVLVQSSLQSKLQPRAQQEGTDKQRRWHLPCCR